MMTRRAGGLMFRVGLASLIAALALAAAMAGAGNGGGDNRLYAQTTVDYDDDDDGLIDIRTLAQLDAIRHNLNGQGDSGAAAYSAAFPNRDTTSGGRMGCPSGSCSGYELRANLDFDTDGDGSTYTGSGSSPTSDSGDDYHNAGAGFVPIGTASQPFTTTFKGNGYAISNLFINRSHSAATGNDTGLFGEISSSARVETVWLIDPYVKGNLSVGALVATNRGTVAASATTGGETFGFGNSGGLVGNNYGTVTASYSTTRAGGVSGPIGGLIGRMQTAGTATASYAAGTVTVNVGNTRGGFVGNVLGTIQNSYWDTNATGIADDGDSNMPEGKTAAVLKAPLGYSGIYENWNVNISGNTDVWDFGTASDHPVLKHGGFDPIVQRGDYDRDDDGLVDITNLAQLNAMRWDLDGDAAQDSVSAANWKLYNAAFFNASASLGCPDTNDAGTDPGPCLGYELAAHLDFDTDGDGSTYSGTGTAAASDAGDAYHNAGSGWLPIGSAASASQFNTTFNGSGYTISNLFVKRTTAQYLGLFGAVSRNSRIENVGILNGYVYGDRAGLLVGYNYGTLAASYTTGAVYGGSRIGGLAGGNYGSGQDVGAVIACYSHASVTGVTTGSSGNRIGGLVGEHGINASIDASYSTGAVTGASGNTLVGAFAGTAVATSTTRNSYWDTLTSGFNDDADANAPEGRTTNILQGEVGYSGIYADWNVNADGAAGGDYPWDFGYANEYPALRVGGMNPYVQRGDYDRDDDGLVEISNLDQLNSVRWDQDGDAAQDSTSAADWKRHNAAFFNGIASLGCPDTDDADTDPGPCLGYELVQDLDFDTNGDGVVDDADDYPSWLRIRYDGKFYGNGNVIRNLTISGANGRHQQVGLFGIVVNGEIVGVGLEDVSISASGGVGMVGTLAAATTGDNPIVRASWATGAITISGATGGVINAAGLVGYALGGEFSACWTDVDITSDHEGNYGGLQGRNVGASTDYLRASYALGDITVSGDSSDVGGLNGVIQGVPVSASYAAGSVSYTGTGGGSGGFWGSVYGTTRTISSEIYWDTQTSGVADDADANPPEGRTTAQLQTPKTYAGIYAGWNVNVDGGADDDDPWDFGDSDEYPALKYGGMDIYLQRGDYDRDDDGLIEITTLDQLNAMRWDLDGDAVQDTTSDADWAKYGDAFPRAIASLGCPDTDDPGTAPGPCLGFELAANLDFDADGDGDNDPADPYHLWTPVGDATNRFDAKFDGNGYAISNLNIETAGGAIGLFGATSTSSEVIRVGLLDAKVVLTSSTGSTTIAGALIGSHAGLARETYATGSLSQTGSGTGGNYGGLIGAIVANANVYASWADVDVSTVAANARQGGFAGSSTFGSGWVRAAYSLGDVSSTGTGTFTAGFIGAMFGNASSVYAAGSVTKTGSGGGRAGLTAGRLTSTPLNNAYWDTTTTGIADDSDTNMPEGRTTEQLQSVLTYFGIYADYRENVDGAAGDDDVWDFGAPDEYPALKFGTQDPYIQRGDYDRDDDGLIEITNLDRLNAVRWDQNGNAVRDTTSAADWKRYNAAFPNAAASLGCPDTDDADTDPGPCKGFELAADLDFDANGDGAVDSADPYPVWDGIGVSGFGFSAPFAGNGRTISNLTVNGHAADSGLFGYVSAGAVITDLGLLDADATARRSVAQVGALAGTATGSSIVIRSVWATGSVTQTGTGNYSSAGGLVGSIPSGGIYASWADVDVSSAGPQADVGGLVGFKGGTLTAAYAAGDVASTSATANVGGLVGEMDEATVSAAYATGAVTKAAGSGGSRGGLVGTATSSTINDGLWDLTTTGVPDDANSASPEGETTANLQSPTDYGTTGIYANWDVNVDGVAGDDDPWDFGGSSEYPALKFGTQNIYIQRGDYDRDDDGLIEITTLAQLNAVRWDLDGDAVRDATSAADWKRYTAAFPRAAASMGCASNTCAGYELAAHLDFDADGDGDVDAIDGYPNWTPIGSASAAYSASFDGDNHKIANLRIYAPASSASIGMFANASGLITKTGLPNARVTVTGGNSNTHVGTLLGEKSGATRGNWATGTVSQTGSGTGGDVGGLIGYSSAGMVNASWAGVHVSSTASAARLGGLVGRMNGGDMRAVYSTGAVSATGNNAYAGGLAGQFTGISTFLASYVTGPATKTGSGGGAGALYGTGSAATITNSVYWDTGTTGFPAGSNTQQRGYGTRALNMPASYTGIYAGWNANVDHMGSFDDPWDFGEMMQYPMLKWGGMSVVAQGSLAMGMPRMNGDTPQVGQVAAVCLVSGPSMRASGPGGTGKEAWQWQRSADGATWTDITDDGGTSWERSATSADLNNYLRACVGLNDTAPEGETRACVQMFAKTVASGS